MLSFETIFVPSEAANVTSVMTRPVTDKDKCDLKEALHEVSKSMHKGIHGLEDRSSHGFSEQLIDDIVERCSTIFSINDITCNFPVFSIVHALRILEVVQELFLDIPNFEETMSFFSTESCQMEQSRLLKFYESLFSSDESDINDISD